MRPRARLLLAEDHAIVAEGLTRALTPQFAICEVVRDGAAVLAAVARQTPDLVLLDLTLPNRSGLDLIRDIRSAKGPPVLVLSMHTEPAVVEQTLELGALGFVPKSATMAELRLAIQTALNGGRYISPLVASRRPQLGTARLRGLTPRQQEVLRLIGEGLSNDQIARRVGVTRRTVYFHRAGIRDRLNLKTDFDMYRVAQATDFTDRR